MYIIVLLFYDTWKCPMYIFDNNTQRRLKKKSCIGVVKLHLMLKLQEDIKGTGYGK